MEFRKILQKIQIIFCITVVTVIVSSCSDKSEELKTDTEINQPENVEIVTEENQETLNEDIQEIIEKTEDIEEKEIVIEKSAKSTEIILDDSSDWDKKVEASSPNKVEEKKSQEKNFVISGENFKFVINGKDSPEIRVKKWDTVRIEFTSKSGFHDWVVDEFDAATEKVKTGGTTTVEFIADQTGTFEYYCSVWSHRANWMVWKFIVE